MSLIWHIGMKESNVIAGFETNGIWPLNKEKYDNPVLTCLFEKYQKWVESGVTLMPKGIMLVLYMFYFYSGKFP